VLRAFLAVPNAPFYLAMRASSIVCIFLRSLRLPVRRHGWFFALPIAQSNPQRAAGASYGLPKIGGSTAWIGTSDVTGGVIITRFMTLLTRTS
jgi:hypothetical protein